METRIRALWREEYDLPFPLLTSYNLCHAKRVSDVRRQRQPRWIWVKRDSWGNTCALVKLVSGQATGDLPGEPSYFNVKGKGNPKVAADVFDLWTGRLKDVDALLSCPGNFRLRANRAAVLES